MLVQAVLLAFGIWWCLDMLPRWQDDIVKIRENRESGDRAVTIFLWAVTAVIAALCLRFGLGLIVRIVNGIRGFF
jgi:hypothetical protein